jgi:hypothetical protein
MPRIVLLAFLAAVFHLTVAEAAPESGFELWRSGKYEQAIASGVADKTPAGATLAARAALSQLMLHIPPCLECARRAEQLARDAIKADPTAPAAHVYLAVALGYEARIVGALAAARDGLARQSRHELEAALHAEPQNALALATLGGWHIDTVRIAGSFLASLTYGATSDEGMKQFSAAIARAPDDPVIAYQYALELASYDPSRYRALIATTLARALADAPRSAFEQESCQRAAALLNLLKGQDAEAFARQVRRFMGIAE